MRSNTSVRQTLVLMAGLPGTGKSTLGYALAKTFDWIVIDKDVSIQQ
jgi:shikimate kinase